MKKIFQVGAGLVGKTMALDLSKDYEVHLADINLDVLNSIKNHDNSIHINQINVQNQNELSLWIAEADIVLLACLLYTSPSPRDKRQSRMPSSA